MVDTSYGPTGYHYARNWYYGRKKRSPSEGQEMGEMEEAPKGADAQSGPSADSYYYGYYGNPWGGYRNYYGSYYGYNWNPYYYSSTRWGWPNRYYRNWWW